MSRTCIPLESLHGGAAEERVSSWLGSGPGTQSAAHPSAEPPRSTLIHEKLSGKSVGGRQQAIQRWQQQEAFAGILVPDRRRGEKGTGGKGGRRGLLEREREAAVWGQDLTLSLTDVTGRPGSRPPCWFPHEPRVHRGTYLRHAMSIT